jgi:hypothetical protein
VSSTAPDYWKLRDELATDLADVPGVLSVGIGRGDSRPILIVIVDGSVFGGSVPSTYKGAAVSIQDLGTGIAHSQLRGAAPCRTSKS